MTGFSIRAGTTYNDKGGISIEIDRVCIHPKYDAYTTDYDVSIVVLKEAFVFSKSIQSISLLLEEEVPDGTIGRITGWGAVEENGDLSDVLRQVDVPKVNEKKCQRYYYNSYRKITDRMSCYGYIGDEKKDACQVKHFTFTFTYKILKEKVVLFQLVILVFEIMKFLK